MTGGQDRNGSLGSPRPLDPPTCTRTLPLNMGELRLELKCPKAIGCFQVSGYLVFIAGNHYMVLITLDILLVPRMDKADDDFFDHIRLYARGNLLWGRISRLLSGRLTKLSLSSMASSSEQ